MTQQGEHKMIGIVVMDAEITDDGEPSPTSDADLEPQYVCQICWATVDEVLAGPCPGPKIPNDISSITSEV